MAMDEDISKLLQNIDMGEDYLYGIYQLSRKMDVDTYDNLFNKDISTTNYYHDLTLNEYDTLFKEKGKPDFKDKIKSLSNHVTPSSGSRIFKKINLKVGIICDEFLYNSYKDVADLDYIPFSQEELTENYDLVIFATAWKGVDGSWQGVTKPYSEKRDKILRLIEECKEKGIPSIFYSKEDPVNYEIFLEIAKRCDVVFTSAEEIIPLYKEAVEHDNVYVLEFGINPHYHNPIGINNAEFKSYKQEVIFAGSWMVKYPVRNEEAEMAFRGVLSTRRDLTIIDRNLELKNKRYHFPPKYINHLSYPLPHDLLMNAHKIFRFAINVNSVKYSNSMFANRVYELQAFGNILLSNFSMGVNSKFPNVFIYNHDDDIPQFLNCTDEQTFREISSAGIRETMNNETTYHRIQYIASKVGIDINIEDERVLVVLKNQNPLHEEMFNSQTHSSKDFVALDKISEVDLSEYDFVTFFDGERSYYEEYYLEELISGFKYTDVNVVSKDGCLEAYNYITAKPVISNSLVDVSYLNESEISLEDLIEGDISETKTFNIDDTEIVRIEETEKYRQNENKKLSVIIPIHNNGKYLENKCFRSLRRSSIFNDMEIIFVNDGSTDEETSRTINRLLRRCPDIIYYEFEKASGSASKPRNKGMELASCKYITFLDPDNEATGDGFSKLYDVIIQDDTLDMVVGNMVKEDEKEKSIFSYYNIVQTYNNKEAVITDTRDFLKKSYLKAQSIQALIIKKEIIKNNNLRMVEGAIGQDTIFYQELLLHSQKVRAIDSVIHMYYGAISDSMTNTISLSFFRKYLKLEKYRIEFLKEHELLDDYIKNRFEYYMSKWYLPRLERISIDERTEAEKLLGEILELYAPYLGSRYEYLRKRISTQVKPSQQITF